MEDRVLKNRERLQRGFIDILTVSARVLPGWVDAIGAGAFISIVTERNPLLKSKIAGLDGKVFLFEATDIQRHFYMKVKSDEVKVVPHFAGYPDVTMKGKVSDLVGMLTGREDPDTIFFSRRLEINGDTAAAIHLKNILNSL